MTNKIIIDLSKKFKKWREGGNKNGKRSYNL